MALMNKETATHRIQVEMNDEGIVIGRELLNSFISLGMLIKPTETKIKSGKNFRIIMEAKKSYTPEEFFAEHQTYMDKFGPGSTAEN